MAITKVLTNTSLDSGTGGNITVTMPTSLLSTDVCVLTIGAGAGNTTVGSYNTPSGWTLVGSRVAQQDAAPGNGVSLQVYVCVGTPAGLTFTASGTIGTKGYLCAAFRGVDNTTPVDATGTGNSNIGAASLTTNAVTIVTDQAWHLIGFADWLGRTFTSTGFTVAVNGEVNESAAVLYNTTPKSVGSTGTQAVAASGTGTGQILAGIPFALRPAGGGPTNYTRLVSDNLGVSDTTARLASSLRLVSNNLGMTDAVARTVASFRTVGDNLGVTDAASRIASSKRLVFDIAGISDSASRTAPSIRVVSDNVALSDIVARVAPSKRVVSDNAAVTDTASRLATSFRVVSDLLGIADTVARKVPSLRVVSDSVGLSDSASRLASHFRLLSDFVAIGDATTVLLIQTGTLLIIARDNVGISDAVSRLATSFRAVSDTLALADACSRAVTSRRLVSDNAAVADAATQKTTSLRLATDSLGLSDVAVRVVSYRRLVSDTLALLDLARITTGTRPFSDYPAGIWQATGASDASLSCGTITLKTNCERFLAMNFRTQPELMYGGQTISTVTLTISPVGLDASPVSNNSTMAGAWFTASTVGTYTVKFNCLLSDGITRIVRTGLCEVVS